jgi:hypothetical protein
MLTITRAPFRRVARIDQRENRHERRRLPRISFHSIRATFDDRWSEPIRPAVVVPRLAGTSLRIGMIRRKECAAVENSKKYEAAAQLAKLRREQDAKKSLSDYAIAAADVRAKTERLRALRLARDAAAPPAVPAAAQRKKQKKAKSAALSEWLDGQSKEGRRS